MAQTIIPEKQTVEVCLKQKNYFIDFYQREYVWKKDTVETLLNDIFYSFEISYTDYADVDITAEIIEKFNWYYLNIFITNNIGGKVYIVDGQQRLSTLTLIAAKLYHMTEDDLLKDTLKDCIFGKDKWKGNIFRIDHEKRNEVMDCVLKDTTYAHKFKNKTEETIVGRYKDISDYLDKKRMDAHKLSTFINYFLERLVLVELTIDKEDTPMIFEVINDRGEALKPFEILKGKLIGALNKQDTEHYSNIWDNSISQFTGNEDNFFIDLIKSKFIFKRNSKLELLINNQYHRYIFDNNEIADSFKFRKKDSNYIKNIKSFIDEELPYYSKLYAKIKTNNQLYLKYNNDINQLSGQYQNILSACSVNDSEEELKITTVAKEIDRLYMLLILNGIYDSNEFAEISYALNEKLKFKPAYQYREVFNHVILNSIKEKKGLQTVPSILEFDSFLKRDYVNMKTRTLRYFLARVENYICEQTNQLMQNDVDYIATRTGDKTGYHIEHILSRNDTNKSYFKDEEDFETKRNILGGLLLLKDKNNISSGNEEYPNKLKTYTSGLVWGHTLNEDYYHCNKDFDAFNQRLLSLTNVQFAPIAEFNQDALYQRSRLLYEIVKLIWEI